MSIALPVLFSLLSGVTPAQVRVLSVMLLLLTQLCFYPLAADLSAGVSGSSLPQSSNPIKEPNSYLSRFPWFRVFTHSKCLSLHNLFIFSCYNPNTGALHTSDSI